MLSYQEDDMENVFLQSFRITYKDVFGTVLVEDLKDDGEKLIVNQTSKEVSIVLCYLCIYILGW